MPGQPFILLTGPLLMGAFVTFFLNGVFAVQLYHYYIHYASTDRRFFVYLVCVVVLIELLHVAFSTHTSYTILAEGFGDPSGFFQLPFSATPLPALNGAGGLLTQFFFAWRIGNLSRNTYGRLTAALVAVTALVQCAAAFGLTVQFNLLERKVAGLHTRLIRTVIVWLAGSFACDILITVAMVTILLQVRKMTTYKSSKTLLSALIVSTVETGMVTTICALADLFCYLFAPNTFFYIFFEFLLGRLYANVLMATLNGRERINMTASNEHEFSANRSITGLKAHANQVQLSAFRTFPTAAPTDMTSAGIHTGPVVSITKDVEVQIDSDDEHTMPQKQDLPY